MVIGDIMLDEYIEGTVDRISPEAPIPVVNLVNSRHRDVRLGGAANVFNNLVSLGCKNVYMCGIIGNDRDGHFVHDKLDGLGMATGGLVVDKKRPTINKTRIIAHNQQVIRLDREDRSPISTRSRNKLINYIRSCMDHLDAIIFSDYEKGVITEELIKAILPLAVQKKITIAVDPKFVNFKYFTDATIVVPNRKEASGFARQEIHTPEDERAAARYIMEYLGAQCVLLKLGERGMRLVDNRGGDELIQTAAEQVYDVTGAGDTVISALVLARAAGAAWSEAARIANVAAGIVIHYIGTTAVTAQQLKKTLNNKHALSP
jgi:D-beta-D-heptose 7-phosphate kinase/D-beta-D-heptose 1-phosphate adenosyltransferase